MDFDSITGSMAPTSPAAPLPLDSIFANTTSCVKLACFLVSGCLCSLESLTVLPSEGCCTHTPWLSAFISPEDTGFNSFLLQIQHGDQDCHHCQDGPVLCIHLISCKRLCTAEGSLEHRRRDTILLGYSNFSLTCVTATLGTVSKSDAGITPT